MALIACKECGRMISKRAKTCPQCGAKNRYTTKFTWAVFGGIVLIIFIYSSSQSDKEQSKESPYDAVAQKPQVKPTKSPEDLRNEKIQKQFSGWDGSHSGLTKYIKASMNDPKSYEHVETRCFDQGDYLTVKTTFRGKNAFGGVVKNWITAEVDFEGNIIRIVAQGP